MTTKDMKKQATAAAEFVKSFAHPARLMVLCVLAEKELNVTELQDITGMGQAALSQHLARLRREGVVTYRRQQTTLYYRLKDIRVRKMVRTLYAMFCSA